MSRNWTWIICVTIVCIAVTLLGLSLIGTYLHDEVRYKACLKTRPAYACQQ